MHDETSGDPIRSTRWRARPRTAWPPAHRSLQHARRPDRTSFSARTWLSLGGDWHHVTGRLSNIIHAQNLDETDPLLIPLRRGLNCSTSPIHGVETSWRTRGHLQRTCPISWAAPSSQLGPGFSAPGTTGRPMPMTRTRSPRSRSGPPVAGAVLRRRARGPADAHRPPGGLTRQRIQTVNRLQRLLSELSARTARKDITALQAKAILAGLRPRDLAGRTRRRLAIEQLTELVAVERRPKR